MQPYNLQTNKELQPNITGNATIYNLQKQDYSHIHVITHSSRGELRTLELETLYMHIRTNPRLSSTHIQPYDSPLQEYRDINKHVEINIETKLLPPSTRTTIIQPTSQTKSNTSKG